MPGESKNKLNKSQEEAFDKLRKKLEDGYRDYRDKSAERELVRNTLSDEERKKVPQSDTTIKQYSDFNKEDRKALGLSLAGKVLASEELRKANLSKFRFMYEMLEKIDRNNGNIDDVYLVRDMVQQKPELADYKLLQGVVALLEKRQDPKLFAARYSATKAIYNAVKERKKVTEDELQNTLAEKQREHKDARATGDPDKVTVAAVALRKAKGKLEEFNTIMGRLGRLDAALDYSEATKGNEEEWSEKHRKLIRKKAKLWDAHPAYIGLEYSTEFLKTVALAALVLTAVFLVLPFFVPEVIIAGYTIKLSALILPLFVTAVSCGVLHFASLAPRAFANLVNPKVAGVGKSVVDLLGKGMTFLLDKVAPTPPQVNQPEQPPVVPPPKPDLAPDVQERPPLEHLVQPQPEPQPQPQENPEAGQLQQRIADLQQQLAQAQAQAAKLQPQQPDSAARPRSKSLSHVEKLGGTLADGKDKNVVSQNTKT